MAPDFPELMWESKTRGCLTLWWEQRLSGTCEQLCPHCALLPVWGLHPLELRQSQDLIKGSNLPKATQQLPGTAEAP